MYCTPPPPPLAAIVRQATQLVSSRVAPIPTPRACLTDEVAPGSGMATPGVVWFSAADDTVFRQSARRWPADRPVVVLHEVLHQVAMANGLEGDVDMAAEEGLVEAVTHDLKRQWLRRVRGRDGRVAIAYRGWVTSVRRASAAATASRWTSRDARVWRAQMVGTPPTARQAIAGIN
jgi:hypothetical protein